jgi:adenylate cyclase
VNGPPKKTILVVDDTPANIALLVEALKAEYRTKVATGGERALAMALGDDPPDLILLDIMMPQISGYEVCERLKADPRTSAIPVIFVTAMGEVEDEERGLALGGVDYVTKPISPPIVRARVRTHLALYEQARQLAARARELAEWNATLERRVADGVAEMEKLQRLKRFFSPSVAELIVTGETDDPLRSRRREIVVVFLDLRGYTSFTESAEPEDVMAVLAEYHAAMGALIMEHGATLERFGGDSIMVFFNDPLPVAEPAAAAARMTLEMQRHMRPLQQGWGRRGFDLSIGIGIAQGFATIGAIGFEGRRDYGAIGTVTNLAARLCGEARGGEILVSQRVLGGLNGIHATEPAGELTLKGFNRPIPAHRLVVAG